MATTEVDALKLLKKNCKTRLKKFKTFVEKYASSQTKESTPIEKIQLRVQRAEETDRNLRKLIKI